MDQLDLVALGATKENFEDVKNNLPQLNKEVKKMKYKKGKEVQCFKLLEKIQRYNSKLMIIVEMYNNDNSNELYKEAQQFMNKNMPMTNSLMKSIYSSLSKEEIIKISKAKGFELIPSMFENFEITLKGYISIKTLIKLMPSAVRMDGIGKKVDKISNAYKSFVGKLMVENKDKTNKQIINLVLKHLKEKQEIYKSTEDEELQLTSKVYKLMGKMLKIKKSSSPEFDLLNTFGLYETFEPVTGIYKDFEKFVIRNRELDIKLLEKTHGKNADALNLSIDKVKYQPTLSIEELKQTYVNALKEFDPKIATFAKENILAEGRYDLSVRESKPTNMAFTLMNEEAKGFISSHYDKTLEWQNTVAHEWGHALQLEKSKTTFNDAVWQPIYIEKPSVLSEYIYLGYLKKITKGNRSKITIIDALLDAGLSRFYSGALALRWGAEEFKKYNPKLSAKETYDYYTKLREDIGYKDYRLESEAHQYQDDLRKFSTPNIMLYQYLPAQANAIVMYQKLRSGKLKLANVYNKKLKTVDLIKYYKTNGIDLNSSESFGTLFKYFEDLLNEKENLIKKLL